MTMKNWTRILLASSGVCTMTHPALAQIAPQSGPQAANSSAVAEGDIVVTANKRDQSINDVGLTISAFGSEAIARQRLTTVADLALATPGLTFAPTPNATPHAGLYIARRWLLRVVARSLS